MAWTPEKNPFGQNRTPVLMGWANDASNTAVPIAADPATGRLLVNATGSSGGTSSTFGATFPTTGTAVGASDGTNMQPLNVDGSGNLKVTGGGGGTQYANGSAQATPTGTVALGWDTANVRALSTDSSGKLNILGTVTANAGTNLNTSALALDATLTGGTQQTKVTDGTNIANVIAGDTGYNAQAIASSTKSYTFTTSASGAQTILANTAVAGYSWIEVVYSSVGSGLALTGQFATASGGTYINSSTFSIGASGNAAALGVATGTLYTGPIRGSFFQIAVSALTSGTFAGTVTLRSISPGPTSLFVSPGSGTGGAVPANAFYVGISDGTNLRGILGAANALNSTGTGIPTAQMVGQFDDVSPTSITENQFGNIRMSANRNIYGTVRDAAGNERGVNVTAGNALQADLTSLAGNALSSGVGASGTGTLRVVEANDVGRTLKSAGGSAASSGNNTLVAAGTNKLKVFAFSLSTSSTSATTCIFQSGAGGTELWRVVLQAPTSVSTGANLAVAVPGYLFNTAAATLLNLNLSGANTIHWSVSYFDET